MNGNTLNTGTVISGHAVSESDIVMLLVGLNMKDRYVMPPQKMGNRKPKDASGGFMQRDAFKAVGLRPDRSVRDQLGGPNGYEYTVHASKSDPQSFYLELGPDKQGHEPIWFKFTGKPGVNLESTTPASDEQIQKTQQQAETIARLSEATSTYDVPPSHLQLALKTGDRKPIGADMVRINDAGKLPEFSADLMAAALPVTQNQDGSVASGQQIEMNKVRNEVMADNLHATILSELLLNQKASTKDGQLYKTPNQIAKQVNDKLLQLSALRDSLGVNNQEPLYYSEDKQVELFSLGQPFKRDDIIRMNVLAMFADLVTPEPGFSKPEFTWGNKVTFLPDGAVAFAERLADIDDLIDQANAGKPVIYDYTIWKHYANKPVDKYQLGPKLERKLVELANTGAEIHMTVDRSVAFRDPSIVIVNLDTYTILGGLLAELAAFPNVTLNFFNNDERGTPGDSNHAKAAIANGYSSGASAVVGGRNIHGDYFHGWMDGEFKIEGKLAQSVQRAEDDMWNQQAKMHNRQNLIRTDIDFEDTGRPGNIIGLATHEMPGPKSTYNGLIGILCGLEISGYAFTLIQAYVLPPIPGANLDPTLEAIKRAVRDGRIVNIVTNSPQTIDVPQISGAIVKYAAYLLDEVNGMPDATGVLRIYMKKKWNGEGGSTLHAKVAYDNKWYVSDTSNNLHANGFLQHESQRYYFDDELNESVRAWGEELISKSDLYTSSAKLKEMVKAIDSENIANPALNAVMNLFPYQL